MRTVARAATAAVIGGLALAAFTQLTARRVGRTLPPFGRFVDVPGARLHVVDRGQGDESILLVHGLAGQLSHFGYGIVDALADGRRVVAVDRPGSGHSTHDRDGWEPSLEAQADALSSLIVSLGLRRPLVVGHSLGGAVALALALRHPQRVGGLALVAPLTHLVETLPRVFRGLRIAQPWLRRLVGHTLATPMSMLTRERTLAAVFGPDAVPADFNTRGGAMLGLRPGHFVAASADLMALPSSLPAQQRRYGELRMPVAVLYGRDDRILDPAAHGQALVDAVPGATIELVDGGHMLPVTAPGRTIDFIAAASARLRQARRDGAAVFQAAAATAPDGPARTPAPGSGEAPR